MKKRKRTPEYIIIETIRKIDNPEKEFILNKKEEAIIAFRKEVKHNGNN